MKQCYICHLNKSLDAFYKDRSSDDGLTNGCKECLKAKERKAYKGTAFLSDRKKELRKIAYKKWKEKHPDKYKAAYEEFNESRKKLKKP